MEICYYMDHCKTCKEAARVRQLNIRNAKGRKKNHNTYVEEKKQILTVIFILTHIFYLTHNENANKNLFHSVRHSFHFSGTFFCMDQCQKNRGGI